ncbi:MAG: zf-HC2 domain-containing protein [Anaerolineaceae bacterium]|nr:zf-HC2 domain-containing protein [Anaerolineaceae bacterium]
MKNNQCCEFITYLNDYVDGTLNEKICKVLEDHMGECNNCQIVVNTLKKTVELYQNDTHIQIPEETRKNLFLSLNLEEFLD